MKGKFLAVLGVAAVAAIAASSAAADPPSSFEHFQPLAASASCTVAGGDPVNPLVLPLGFTQKMVASEADPDFKDLSDMNTLNETGPNRGRYLFRAHEVGANGAVTRTDLVTGDTVVLATDPSFIRLDGIEWTSWGTLLIGPEHDSGRIIEMNPWTGSWQTRPALGVMAHEGIQADAFGIVYVIDENASGSIYRFVPDHPRDLSSGQLYALRLTAGSDPATKLGPAEWVPLDRNAVQVAPAGGRAAADVVNATGYGRPEDVERRGNTLYVAITSENRVLAIDLSGAFFKKAFVREFVGPNAGNAPADFASPDNLVSTSEGNLFITEDPGGNFPGKTIGDDIWVADRGHGFNSPADEVVRFASINDCDAEPTGIYFDGNEKTLYVNIQHRGGNGLDLAMAVTEARGHGHDH